MKSFKFIACLKAISIFFVYDCHILCLFKKWLLAFLILFLGAVYILGISLLSFFDVITSSAVFLFFFFLFLAYTNFYFYILISLVAS
jgi:hypothetical protein